MNRSRIQDVSQKVGAIFFCISALTLTSPAQATDSPGLSAQVNADTPSSSTAEELEISRSQYFAGAVAGTFVGFGLGHAIQDRYEKRGLLYSVGEAGTLLIAMNSIAICNGDDSVTDKSRCPTRAAPLISLGAFAVLKLLEIVDVWLVPTLEINPEAPASSPRAFFTPITLTANASGEMIPATVLGFRF